MMSQLVHQDGGGGRQTQRIAAEKGGDGQRACLESSTDRWITRPSVVAGRIVKELPRKLPTSQWEESTVFANKEKQMELKP